MLIVYKTLISYITSVCIEVVSVCAQASKNNRAESNEC